MCDQPATRRLGSYEFCEGHYARALAHRGGVVRADVASVAVLVAFTAAAWAFDRGSGPELAPVTLLLASAVLALVPAIVWLALFYRRDRYEPEPKVLVLQVFVLGALLAGAVGIPLVERVFDTSTWLYRVPIWQRLLAGVLVIGFTQEYLKYAAVRFFVFDLPEFDELTDGIVYAVAAGLGYATALNIAFVAGTGGVDLGPGAVRVALTALAHASFAGVTGYFLGSAKMRPRPLWWMPIGVTIAAVLNGLFFFLRGMLSQGGLSADGGNANPWAGLAMAVLLVFTVTGLLSRAMNADIEAASAAGGERS